MSLYGALDGTKHLEEFGTPLDTQAGTLSAAARKALALANLGLPLTAELAFLAGVTAGTGLASKAAVLDSSGNYIMPAGGMFGLSRAALTALGTNQATAAPIVSQVAAVLAADNTVGVALPAAAATLGPILVINTVANKSLPVFPVASGNDNINAAAANASYVLGPGEAAWFVPTSGTQWYALPAAATNKVSGTTKNILITASATPLALDGSNPTSFAHGLTTCTAAFAQLVGSVAPGDSTNLLTCVINGANVDVYAWKHQDGADPTMVASTGTETFNWLAIGV